MSDLINRLQSDIYADSDVAFVDCAMGYCGTYAKTVECWVDTKIPNISSGRFTCRLDDGN